MKGVIDFPDAARRYSEFRAAVFNSNSIQEPVLPLPDPNPASELEIQARWFAGEFGRSFTSTDGKPVEVVQFGHWNRSAGPDFTEAVVRIGGEERAGPIEIDLEASSWEAHGHGSNPAFDSVVLQVFLGREGDTARFFTRTSQHREVPQIAIAPADVTPRGTFFGHLPEAKLGRCATPLREMPNEQIESLLDAAAQHRLLQKARRLNSIGEAHSENQALFQAIAEALGFRYNKVTMAVLTQRLPLKDLRGFESIVREALLFGVADFSSHDQFESADPDAREYLKSLWDHWWKLRGDFETAPERQLHWRLSGTRPTNHPQRRIGALAALTDHWQTFCGLFPESDTASSDWPKNVRKHLAGLSHSYWQNHYTLKSKRSRSPMALIGKDRIQDILGNVLFPLIAQNAPGQWKHYRKLPGSDVNESLRRAVLRLFGQNHPASDVFTRKYWQQQAMLQIYRDFCLEDTTECAECPFPEQLAQWEN